MRAREVTPEQQPRLHNIVEGLSIAAGIPKPRVYLVPEAAQRLSALSDYTELGSGYRIALKDLELLVVRASEDLQQFGSDFSAIDAPSVYPTSTRSLLRPCAHSHPRTHSV